jgi:hypothetical protein
MVISLWHTVDRRRFTSMPTNVRLQTAYKTGLQTDKASKYNCEQHEALVCIVDSLVFAQGTFPNRK